MRIKLKIALCLLLLSAILTFSIPFRQEIYQPIEVAADERVNAATLEIEEVQIEGAENNSDLIHEVDEVILRKNTVFVENELERIEQEKIIEEFDDLVYTTLNLNYRTGPSEDYDVVGVFETGAELNRIGLCNNGWVQILHEDEIYYVHGDYVTEEKQISVPHQTVAEGDKGTYQQYAYSLFSNYGWTTADFDALIILWNRESNWNPYAENSSSGAYGIPQSLPGDKMASMGDDWRTNYQTQIRWGCEYISQRYGNPTNALQHSYDTGWY